MVQSYPVASVGFLFLSECNNMNHCVNCVYLLATLHRKLYVLTSSSLEVFQVKVL